MKDDLQVVEALAFHFFGESGGKEMTTWRSPDNVDVRKACREKANMMLGYLESIGLKVGISSSSKLSRFITKLITQPANVTYTLEDEQQ